MINNIKRIIRELFCSHDYKPMVSDSKWNEIHQRIHDQLEDSNMLGKTMVVAKIEHQCTKCEKRKILSQGYL